MSAKTCHWLLNLLAVVLWIAIARRHWSTGGWPVFISGAGVFLNVSMLLTKLAEVKP